MKNKKGQFYFLGALIIILVIISFLVLNNTIIKKENPELNHLKEELNFEIEKNLEYAVNSELTDNEIQTLFINFSSNYITKIGSNKNILFMFGKQNDEVILKGQRIADSEDISVLSGTSTVNISEGNFEETIATAGENITLISGENYYFFDLLEGQNFYYFITKEYKGEKQIIIG